jgi:hypothetical protein
MRASRCFTSGCARQENKDKSGCALRQWSAHYRRNPQWLSTTAAIAADKTAGTPEVTAAPTADHSVAPTTPVGIPADSAPRKGGAQMDPAVPPVIATVSRLVIVRAVRGRVRASRLVIATVSRLVIVSAVRGRVSASPLVIATVSRLVIVRAVRGRVSASRLVTATVSRLVIDRAVRGRVSASRLVTATVSRSGIARAVKAKATAAVSVPVSASRLVTVRAVKAKATAAALAAATTASRSATGRTGHRAALTGATPARANSAVTGKKTARSASPTPGTCAARTARTVSVLPRLTRMSRARSWTAPRSTRSRPWKPKAPNGWPATL